MMWSRSGTPRRAAQRACNPAKNRYRRNLARDEPGRLGPRPLWVVGCQISGKGVVAH